MGLVASMLNICDLQSLDKLGSLELLELGDNIISQLTGLEQLHSLRELWLGRNRITSIDGLSRYAVSICTSAVHLSLS